MADNFDLPASTGKIGTLVGTFSGDATTHVQAVVPCTASGSEGSWTITPSEGTEVDTDDVLITRPYALSASFVTGRNTATGTSNTELLAAAGSGNRNYVTTLIVSNSSATNTEVHIKSASTTKLTIPAPANFSGAVIVLPTPFRGGDNEAVNFASASGVTTMTVSVVGYTST